MSKKFTVQVEKSPIPIIWLDTSIIISIAQLIYDRSRLAPISASRAEKLYNFIREGVKKKKIICPLSEQESEIWIDREVWFKVMNDLSLGINTKTQQSIMDGQFYHFFKSYWKDELFATISYLDAFNDNPIEELSEILNAGYSVIVNPRLIFGERYQKDLKEKMLKSFNQLRRDKVRDGIKFTEQLDEEYKAHLLALSELSMRFLSGEYNDENTFFGFMNLSNELRYVKSITSSDEAPKILAQYYASNVYKEMPYAKITSYLYAYIVTDKQEVKSGDYKDIQHISTMFPYVDFFLTDKRMKHLIRKFNFDKIYKTKVCYIGDEEEVEIFFDNL